MIMIKFLNQELQRSYKNVMSALFFLKNIFLTNNKKVPELCHSSTPLFLSKDYFPLVGRRGRGIYSLQGNPSTTQHPPSITAIKFFQIRDAVRRKNNVGMQR